MPASVAVKEPLTPEELPLKPFRMDDAPAVAEGLLSAVKDAAVDDVAEPERLPPMVSVFTVPVGPVMVTVLPTDEAVRPAAEKPEMLLMELASALAPTPETEPETLVPLTVIDSEPEMLAVLFARTRFDCEPAPEVAGVGTEKLMPAVPPWELTQDWSTPAMVLIRRAGTVLLLVVLGVATFRRVTEVLAGTVVLAEPELTV